MDSLEFQKLMEHTFKSSFIVNILSKLYSKEISKEDYIKLLNEKKSEIAKQNPSLSEIGKYQKLMTISDEKIETLSTNATSESLKTKIKTDNIDTKKIIKFSYSFYYILFLLIVFTSSLLLSAKNVKFGRPVLIKNETTPKEHDLRFLQRINENGTNFELFSDERNMKLNFKEYSLLILPKMKKLIIPTIEGALGFFTKFGLVIINLYTAILGRFYDKKFVRWVKIRVAVLFFFLPIIRLYIVNKINNNYITNYQNEELNFYKSKELFQYNPKNLPYNLNIEIPNCLFSMYLALNSISGFAIEAFYQSNSYVSEIIKKYFDIKNKLN